MVKIKLLTGKKLLAEVKGPPPSYLKIQVPSEDPEVEGTKEEPGPVVWCKRVDVDRYAQMTIKQMRKEGLLAEDPFDPDSTHESSQP